MQVHVQGRYLQGPRRADIAGHELNAKLFQTATTPDSSSIDDAQAYSASPTKHTHPQPGDRNNVTAEETLRRIWSRVEEWRQLSTSLPMTSPLGPGGQGLVVSFRANSEMGH